MGNKLGRKRQVVDDKYTKPQGLYQHKDVDHKKLRKLILDSKLAPCYPGDDDCACDLEECPICFLYYPSLNRSRCCTKGICTECFLQMKTPNSTRPTQCPFCKTSNYAVEYRGVKTKEEKGMEQLEEQRVIEAKIRMRQQELQDEEDRVLKQREVSSSSSMRAPTEVDYYSTRVPSFVSTVETEEIVESNATSAIRPSPRQRQTRDEEFDLDLEDIMVMEAIWLSIQESGKRQDLPYTVAAQYEEYPVEDRSSMNPTTEVAGTSSSSSSPSGGLACAIAALAERQQTSGEASNSYGGEYNVGGSGRYLNRECESYFPGGSGNVENEMGMRGDGGEWVDDERCDMAAQMGSSSYGGGCDEFENSCVVPPQEDVQAFTNPGPIIPESFEEQMMLAMAVSLAEARARTTTPGVAWH